MNRAITIIMRTAPIVGLVALTAMVVLFNPADPPAESKAEDIPTVTQVLNAYVNAVGGRMALEKLTTRVCIGTVTTDLTSREQPIYERQYCEAYAKIPDRYHVETWTDGGNHIRAFDGDLGWTKDRCGVHEDETAGTRRLDWLLSPQFALRLEELSSELKVTGTQAVRGMVVYVLDSPHLHRPLFFDTATGLLVGFGHNWEIHDYREVDGILYPHKIHMSRKGGSTVYEFSEVRHNDAVSDSLFVIPEIAR